MQSKRKLFTSLTCDTSLRRQVRNSIEILSRPIAWEAGINQIAFRIADQIKDLLDDENDFA